MIRAESLQIVVRAAAIFLAACSAHSQTDPTSERIAGCYALSWQPWTAGKARADSNWQTPDIEQRVWLTVTPIGIRQPGRWFVVRPAPGERASAFGDVRWSWNETTQRVVIEWDATMAGIRLALATDQTGRGLVELLDGTAQWWSTDTTVPPDLNAKVRATRQACTDLD